MNNKGVSLVEVLVVIAVAATLAAGLKFSYDGWQGSYKVESQMKQLHTDIMKSRIKAMQRNRAHFVMVSADEYSIFEDTNENGTFDSGTDDDMERFSNPQMLERDINGWTGTLTISTRGLVAPETTLRVDAGSNHPEYDCITLRTTRLNLGSWDGANCNAK